MTRGVVAKVTRGVAKVTRGVGDSRSHVGATVVAVILKLEGGLMVRLNVILY